MIYQTRSNPGPTLEWLGVSTAPDVRLYLVLDDRPRRNARVSAVPFDVRLAGTTRIIREKGHQ